MGAPCAASASRSTSALAGTSVPGSRTPSQTSPPGSWRRQSSLQTTGRARRAGCSLIAAACQVRAARRGTLHRSQRREAGENLGVSVQLNHTIVSCRDQKRSAAFLTGILGLPPATVFGPFHVVEADNGVSLDFRETSGEITAKHYALLVGQEEFDA